MVEEDAITLLGTIAREPMKSHSYYEYKLGWGDPRFSRAKKWLAERGLITQGHDGRKWKLNITAEGLAFLRGNGQKTKKAKEKKIVKKVVRGRESRKLLLEITREKGPVSTGNLYREYVRRCHGVGITPITKRNARRVMKGLAREGIVSERPVHGGSHGNTTIYEYRGDKSG
jgi:hypothetical protein